jgi:N-acetylglutamate synthase-like GNAT family acetyltransferase
MDPVFRKLCYSDQKDILEISRHIWDGNDYLPSVFDQWLEDSCSHFYGIEVDGRVVAVGNLRLIEKGLVGWMEGLRVHPDYRGRGFANLIQDRFLEMAKELNLQKLRYVTGSENLASLKLAENTGFSRILTMPVTWISKPKTKPEAQDYAPIRNKTPKDVCTLLKAKPRIIPHGILIYEWKALSNTCANLEEIGQTHAFQVAIKDNEIDSLSFGLIRDSWWNTTIYAVTSQGFLAQLSYNLDLAHENHADSLTCIYQRKYEKIMANTDLKSEEIQRMDLILLEKRI